MSLASLTGTLPSWVTSSANGSAFIKVNGQAITGTDALASLRGTQGASLDARISDMPDTRQEKAPQRRGAFSLWRALQR